MSTLEEGTVEDLCLAKIFVPGYVCVVHILTEIIKQ